MKYLLLPVSLFLLVSCQGNLQEKMKPEHSETDWAFYKLNGDVHTVSERNFIITGATSNPGRENGADLDYDRTFDDFGYLIHEKKWAKENVPYEDAVLQRRDELLKRTQYTAGKPTIITENTWDEAKEHLTGSIRRNPDNTQISREFMVYEEGKLTMKVKYNGQDIPVEKVVYGYDKNGNLTKEGIFPNAATLDFKVAYEYDKDNNKISETRSGKNKVFYKSTYTYTNKKLDHVLTTNDKGETTLTEDFAYDKKGNITEHIITESRGGRTAEIFEYDAKNNITKWLTASDNNPDVLVYHAYDAEGNVISTKTQVGKDAYDDRNYTYQYDEHKNWTKKTVTIKGVNTYEVKRKITYF